ncbi:hypothetical protein lbkm_1480 [Lachnospiraceae bacterium KM106-2]|nr:hypothetical protein lbkm_1480 [Lachnospiraceae bacterium KM106-2]
MKKQTLVTLGLAVAIFAAGAGVFLIAAKREEKKTFNQVETRKVRVAKPVSVEKGKQNVKDNNTTDVKLTQEEAIKRAKDAISQKTDRNLDKATVTLKEKEIYQDGSKTKVYSGKLSISSTEQYSFLVNGVTGKVSNIKKYQSTSNSGFWERKNGSQKVMSLEKKNMEKFDHITVDSDLPVDCELKKGSSYSVNAEFSGINYTAKYTNENGVLTISTKTSGVQTNNNNNRRTNYIVITVPEGTRLEEVGLNVSVGDITVTQIKMKNASLIVGTGDIQMKESTASECKADSGTGDVDITGWNRGNLAVKVGCGDISIGCNAARSQFICHSDTGLGDNSIDGKNPSTAPYQMNLDSGLGDTNVTFQE